MPYIVSYSRSSTYLVLQTENESVQTALWPKNTKQFSILDEVDAILAILDFIYMHLLLVSMDKGVRLINVM